MFSFDPVAERSICIFVPKCLLPRPVAKLYVYNLNEIQLNILTHNTKINCKRHGKKIKKPDTQQYAIYKAQHRKLMTEQHEPYRKSAMKSTAPKG